MKFIDPNPLNRVVFGTIGMGPDTKNLARLNDPPNELRRKERIGRGSVWPSSAMDMRLPFASAGKNEEFNMISANEMWHCKMKHM